MIRGQVLILFKPINTKTNNSNILITVQMLVQYSLIFIKLVDDLLQV